VDFSIVTATFRQLDLLKRCVSSVADQEGVSVEHVVQDGGTAGFADFEEEVRRRWPDKPGYSLRLTSEPDHGMYDGINRGLKKTQGQICGYLNSDEQYLPGALAKVLWYFQKKPKLGSVLGDVLVIRSDGEPLCWRKALVPTLPHTWTCHFSALTAGIFFRRELIEQGLLYDTSYRMAADAEWFIRLLSMGTSVEALGQLTSTFMETGENLSLGTEGKAEARRIYLEAPMSMRWGRPGWVLLHRLKKLFAGAYAKKTFDYDIYVEASKKRKRFHAKKLGAMWPGRFLSF
jgi:glycosyltransferase involved in cell wall biosynthesis